MKKKRELVIIAGSCYPINSATGGLALKCANFLREEYTIRLISLQEGKFFARGMQLGCVSLYTLDHWRLSWFQISKEKFRQSSGPKAIFYQCSYLLSRAIGRLQSTFFSPGNLYWFKDKSFKMLEELDNDRKIDLIITFSAPIESHLAAKKFTKKNQNVCWISYWADLYAIKSNKKNIFISLERMKKIEKDLIASSDLIFVTEEIYDIFIRDSDSSAVKEIIPVPYFMRQEILERNVEKPTKNKGPIRFLYMGSLYRDIRNPEYMLKIFNNLKIDYMLDLYVTGNCDDIVKKYSKYSNGRIINHGPTTLVSLDFAMQNASVLINIENTISTSNPSKVFELIAYRKPILNFANEEKGSSVFLKYPKYCEITSGKEIELQAAKLLTFLQDIDSVIVSKEYLLDNYAIHTEEYVKNLISRNVGNIINLKA